MTNLHFISFVIWFMLSCIRSFASCLHLFEWNKTLLFYIDICHIYFCIYAWISMRNFCFSSEVSVSGSLENSILLYISALSSHFFKFYWSLIQQWWIILMISSMHQCLYDQWNWFFFNTVPMFNSLNLLNLSKVFRHSKTK